MNQNVSTKLKVAFLLIVFSMNTVIGFACAVGLDMGFNSKHEHDECESKKAVHPHEEGVKHAHPGQNESHAASNHHEEVNNPDNEDSDNDNCCNKQVTKFEQLDKAIPHSFAINPVSFTAFIFSFYNIDILVASQITKSTKSFVRGHHPPIPDILIAIQRFQI